MRRIWEKYMEQSHHIRYMEGMKELCVKRKETIERVFGDAKKTRIPIHPVSGQNEDRDGSRPHLHGNEPQEAGAAAHAPFWLSFSFSFILQKRIQSALVA